MAKACSLIEEAARNGAALIAFPETYIPAFPLWSAVEAPIHNHEWFKRLAASSIRCPGPELERIAGAARRHGVIVSLGFNEGTADSVGCLWNSNVLMTSSGTTTGSTCSICRSIGRGGGRWRGGEARRR